MKKENQKELSSKNESNLIRLLDLVFIPTSFLRFAHREILRESKSKLEKIIPYTSSSIWEVGRLYGYYELAKYLHLLN